MVNIPLKIRVLMFLIEQRDEKINIAMISNRLGINYKNVYSVVKKLAADGIISLEKFGRTNICTLVEKNNPLIFWAEYVRRERLLKERGFKVIYDALNLLRFSFECLIFGSYAKNSATRASDVDLMIIADQDREKLIRRTISVIPLDIHLTFLTEEEFLTMAGSNTFNVVSEALKKNIILIGIEDHYRRLEYAG